MHTELQSENTKSKHQLRTLIQMRR